MVPPVFSSDNDIYLSLAFKYDDVDHLADGDELILTAKDEDGNVYQGAKLVPSEGFKNSCYYYGSMTLEWKKQDIRPTITPNTTENYTLYSDGEYSFDSSENPDPTIFTISGKSVGYYFTLGDQEATITLDGGPATYSGTQPFIYSDCWSTVQGVHAALTIELSSNYCIDCRNNNIAIDSEDDLKLKTTGGGTYTLTVITNDLNYRGLYGLSNYKDDSCEPSALAATGYKVELTSATPVDEDSDGNPDYYTWVYTVTPSTNP